MINCKQSSAKNTEKKKKNKKTFAKCANSNNCNKCKRKISYDNNNFK